MDQIRQTYDIITGKITRGFNQLNNPPNNNIYGKAAWAFEDGVDNFWANGPGSVVNLKNSPKLAGMAILGGVQLTAAASIYTDPFLNQQAPIIFGAWAGLVGGAAIGGANIIRKGIAYGSAQVNMNQELAQLTGNQRNLAIFSEGFLKPAGRFALGAGQRGAFASAGLAGPALSLAGGAIGGALQFAAGAELVGRTLMTARPLNALRGGPMMASNAIDAYLPNFNNAGAKNIMKYAPNPTLIRRYAGLAAAKSLVGSLNEVFSPAAPPPTAIFDGRHMHHRNDMGAGANYAQNVLGRNSDLNLPPASTMAAAIF